MRIRVIRSAVLVAVLVLAMQASAASYAFVPTVATFTPGGVLWFGPPGVGTLDFTLGLQDLTGVTVTLDNIGDTATVPLGTLTLQETDITVGHTPGAAGLDIAFTLGGIPTFTLSADAVLSIFGPVVEDPEILDALVSFGADSSVHGVDPVTGILATVVAGNIGGDPAAASNPAMFSTLGDSQMFYARFELVPIPEPSTIGLALLGLAFIAVGVWRRRSV